MNMYVCMRTFNVSVMNIRVHHKSFASVLSSKCVVISVWFWVLGFPEVSCFPEVSLYRVFCLPIQIQMLMHINKCVYSKNCGNTSSLFMHRTIELLHWLIIGQLVVELYGIFCKDQTQDMEYLLVGRLCW